MIKKPRGAFLKNAPKTAQNSQVALAEKKADATLGETKAAEENVTPEDIIAKKMETYIRCFNAVDGSVYRSAERYASWLEDIKVAGMDTSEFISAAENYQLAAKQLIRRIRDHEDFNEGDKMMLQSALSASMVDGSFSKVMKNYNDMVANYNRLN